MGKKHSHGFGGKGRSTGKPKRRWEDNIETNLEDNEKAWYAFYWLRTGTSGGLT
jgi:hypothetical protein